MEKATFALAVVSAVLAYFSISEKRLVELKMFACWCSLAVLIFSHAHSLYRLGTSTEPMTLIKILTLNLAALGVLVLIAAGVFFKKNLRHSLEFKKTDQ